MTSIPQAIYTLRNWFRRHDITLDPKYFRVRLEFDRIQDYAQFEAAVRHDISREAYLATDLSPLGGQSDRCNFMGIEIVCKAPLYPRNTVFRDCDCQMCRDREDAFR